MTTDDHAEESGIAARASALLERVAAGDGKASEEMLAHLYGELKGLAQGQLRHERANHTLQATALVHEAWLRMVGTGGDLPDKNRTQFLGIAAIAMRRVLTDHARRRLADKRGGDQGRITLTDSVALCDGPSIDLLDLDAALEKLGHLNERHRRVVELRFFAGLEIDEVADILHVTSRTVDSDWAFAKSWLRRELSRREP